METKCKHCGYKWTCKSKMTFVTCPSCLKKTEVVKEVKKEEGTQNKS